MARGAVEVAPGHYPLMVAVHAAWLISLWVFGHDQPVNVVALAALSRAARLSLLGDVRRSARDGRRGSSCCRNSRWCRAGPYRYLSHPNYAVVAGEIAVLPLVLGLPLRSPSIFTVLNAAVLAIRIRAENRALAAIRVRRGCAATSDERGRRRCRTRRASATWLGFLLMCLGMFMAILDIQVVATSLPTIQHALAISRDAMSWIQTAYLIAEIIAIPLTGWLTRVLTLAVAVRRARSAFSRSPRSAAPSAAAFAILVGFRVLQGFAGGTLIPAVFSAVFLLFPLRLHPVATTIGRHRGGAGADHRTGRRRLDHRDLVLALAVPDQCRARRDRGRRDAIPAAARQDSASPNSATLDRASLTLMAIALASLEIGLKQAPQDGWLSPLCAGAVRC